MADNKPLARRNRIHFRTASILYVKCAAAWATDVVNQDDKSYNLKVLTETKYTSNYVIKARGTIYELCGANHVCSFEIAGSRVVAKNDARVTIRNGKLEAKAK